MSAASPLETHLLDPAPGHVFCTAFADALAAAGAADAVRWTAGPRETLDADRLAVVRVLVAGRPGREVLEAARALTHLVIPFAGLPAATREVLLALDPERRPAVHNLHHNAAATAELAVGLLLAAARRLPALDARLREGDWRDRHDEDAAVGGYGLGRVLDGARAVVVGHGAVGRRVARALAGLGLRTTAVRRRGAAGGSMASTVPGPGASLDAGVGIVGVDRLDAVLDGAEALVLACPLTDETRGLLDARRLDRLARGALVVNVARGEVVDEDALFARLADGRLGGAGLDTWWRSPEDEAARAATPPGARPWHDLPHVAMTPHVGGMGGGAAMESARATALAALLAAISRGGPVPDRVDPGRGY